MHLGICRSPVVKGNKSNEVHADIHPNLVNQVHKAEFLAVEETHITELDLGDHKECKE